MCLYRETSTIFSILVVVVDDILHVASSISVISGFSRHMTDVKDLGVRSPFPHDRCQHYIPHSYREYWRTKITRSDQKYTLGTQLSDKDGFRQLKTAVLHEDSQECVVMVNNLTFVSK